MNTVPEKINDKRAKEWETREQVSTSLLSLILRGGVILSAVIIGLGVVLFIVTGQSGYTVDTTKIGAEKYITYHESNPVTLYFPTNPAEIWDGIISFKPFALIMLGILVLIATPILNVVLAGYGFLKQGNRAFTLISLFVLVVLVLSFILGRAGG